MQRRSQRPLARAHRPPPIRTIRSTLRERVALVERLQRQVERQGQKSSPRVVHDLRVATRRADAGLRLYGAWLPARRARRLRQRLQKLRRSAGPLRDLDVLREFLARPSSAGSTSAHRRLQRRLSQRRHEAAHAVAQKSGPAARQRLQQSVRSVAKRVRWRGREAELTCAQLFEAVRTSSEWLATAPRQLKSGQVARLHRLRIRLRRLRYQLELLADLLLPSPQQLPALLATLRALQDCLGARHDAAMHRQILTDWRRQECENTDERKVLDACLTQLLNPSAIKGPQREALRLLNKVQRLLQACQVGSPPPQPNGL